MINHAMKVVDESILGDFLLRIKYIRSHIESVDGEIDLVVHLFIEHDIMLLEAIEAKDEYRSDSI